MPVGVFLPGTGQPHFQIRQPTAVLGNQAVVGNGGAGNEGFILFFETSPHLADALRRFQFGDVQFREAGLQRGKLRDHRGHFLGGGHNPLFFLEGLQPFLREAQVQLHLLQLPFDEIPSRPPVVLPVVQIPVKEHVHQLVHHCLSQCRLRRLHGNLQNVAALH